MAILKSIDVGGDAPFSYIRLDTFERCDEPTKTAVLHLRLYASKTAAGKPNGLNVTFGHAFFRGPAFDLYFTRKALAAAALQGKSIHRVGYLAIGDLLTAWKARDSLALYERQQQVYQAAMQAYDRARSAYDAAMSATPAPNPAPAAPTKPDDLPAAPPPLTAQQAILAEPGNAYAPNNFGHIYAYDGAQDDTQPAAAGA